MQFVRYTTGSAPQWGIRRDDGIVSLAGMREDVTCPQLTDDSFLTVAADAVGAADQAFSVDEARLLVPVPWPGKIICVGLNYHDHDEEQDKVVPERPLLLGKADTSVTNPDDPIVNPTEIEELDYEVDVKIAGIGTLINHVVDE